jgi:hypothetical protein
MFKKITKTPVTPLPIDSNSFTASEWNSLNNEVYNLFKNYFPEPDYFFNTIPSEAGIEDVTPYALQSLDMLKNLDNDDTYYIDEDSFEYVPYGDLQQLYKFKIYSGKKNKNNVLNTNDTNNLIQQRTPNIIKFHKFDIPFFLDSNNEPYIKKDTDFDITIESDDFLLTGVTLGEVNINTKQYYESVGDYVYDITLKRRDNTSIYDFLKKESNGSFDYTLNEYKYFDDNEGIFSSLFKIKRTDNPYGSQEYNLFLTSYCIDGYRMIQFGADNNINFGFSIDGENFTRINYKLTNDEIVFYEKGISGDISLKIDSNSILGSPTTDISNDYNFVYKKYVDDAIANNTGSFDYSLEEYKYFEATKDTEQAFMIQRYPQYIGTYDTEYRLFIRSDYISNKHDIMELTNQMLIFGKADYQDAEYIDKQNPDDVYLSISKDAIRTNRNYYYIGNYGDDDVLVPKWYVDEAIDNIGELVITENLDMKNFNIVRLAEPVNLQDATTKLYVDTVIDERSFDYSLNEYKFTGYDNITPAVTIRVTQDGFNYFQNIYSLCFSPATANGNVTTHSILNNMGLFLGKMLTTDYTSPYDFDKTNDYINLVNYGEYNESYIELFNKPSNSKIKISGDYILGDANTKITNDYNFTTKKYVDEKIGVIFCSSRKLIQQNTNNKTLAGQSFYRPIDFCNILATGGYENSKSFTKQGNTNSVLKETNMVNGYQRQLVIGISLGHNNTMSSKKVECSVALKRGDGTFVRGGNSMIFYDTQTRLQTSTTLTVTIDTADAFVSQGWYLEIQNLNDANDGGSVLTFSTIDILINVVQLPKLAGV